MATYVGTLGNDTFNGATPNASTYNILYGLDGNDTLTGSFPGTMDIDGGAGNDVLYSSNAVQNASMFGGLGNDYIDASANGYGTVYLDGGTGNDTLIGGGLNCTLVGDGADSMVGASAEGATQFFDSGYGSTTMVGGQFEFNTFHASGAHDSLTGGLFGDQFFIDGGYDTVVGGGDSTFQVTSSNNSISGGAFSDVFFVGGSANLIRTGDGANTVWAQTADNATIQGGAGNDTVYIGGTSPGSTIVATGGGGNDTISGVGGQGVLFIRPGTGSGTNVVIGDDYSSHIYGSQTTGALFMRGGNGTDELQGGQGSNFFIGSAGGDFAQAGGQANAFEFDSASDGNLHIAGFNANTDHFGIDAGGFGSGLSGGETLTTGYNLINGTTPVAPTGTFLYTGGLLYFDGDGTGAAKPILLAGLEGPAPATLSPNNFAISGSAF